MTPLLLMNMLLVMLAVIAMLFVDPFLDGKVPLHPPPEIPV